NITLEPCTKSNISSFKRLNTLLLPIPYPSKFYDEILSDPTTQSLTLLAVWRDNPLPTEQPGRVIGGIRCRLLSASAATTAGLSTTSARRDASPDPLLYISTLTVLSPYRHYGIATHLLSRITTVAMQQYKITAVGAHVWVNNKEGRAWYKKRGFREDRLEEAYYRRLEPKAAVVV
ncbi:acyl-CoA N-acyltransferase, partial [Delphinella strobiligena]